MPENSSATQAIHMIENLSIDIDRPKEECVAQLNRIITAAQDAIDRIDSIRDESHIKRAKFRALRGR